MMKSLKKLILLMMVLALLVGSVFAISVFAEETEPEAGTGETTEGGETTEEEAKDPLWTPYGMIPEAYASVDDYPIVIFEKKGTDSETGDPIYEFVDAKDSTPDIYKVLMEDTNNKSALQYMRYNSGAIYLRCDYTIQNSYSNAASSDDGRKVIIDLGGHVLSYNKSMNISPKGGSSSKETHPTNTIVFKNGTLEASAAVVFLSYNINTRSSMTMAFEFEDITFRLAEALTSAPKAWLASTASTKASYYATYNQHNFPLTLTNCTFDLRKIPDTVPIFTLGDEAVTPEGSTEPKYLFNNTITINGCNFLGVSNKVKFGTLKGLATLSIEKDANGNYLFTSTRYPINIGSEKKPVY